ncbi:bifunctional cytochrome P450/NADPH--P450 reductase [Bacillus chungangensis]|uniref:Bifunctional cytochrome P450/NADPH--P450 reductase n=1 Tax=Bacillus chungangensis TaxID=587633 RepID=A0ABT9WQU1_9BACI|nr:bifunctional cytochrome P450/NADPH--P450 reductase [Bacillus chungangensis]MDQ0175531.1 cytochrome P450/NADPH-cytochrome P450 reductase [Bacillus chungangensis]
MTIAIPQPKTYGPLGNIPHINTEKPVQSFIKLANELGDIFRMKLPFGDLLIVSGYELVKELSDSSRFDKVVDKTILEKVRAFLGDGLFTSETEEMNWRKAHNILLPSFSRTAMRGYFDMMLDLAMQLIQKWSRLNPDECVDVPEDMTRLALDTIGLCGFNYRFNSFYREDSHPFVASMVRALSEAMSQAQRIGIQDIIMVKSRRQFKEDIEFMFSMVDKIIADRKAHDHQEGSDLLAHMLKGKDPETGEALDVANIRYQIITFLIAGHETTSGLLSFALYFLLNNRDKLQKGYEEVDRVLTDSVPSYAQVKNLKYIRMILDEALRLWPTAPAFNLQVKEDTTVAGKYALKKGERIVVLIPQLHRDVSAWGEDAEEFKPERFENPSLIPHDAYKPFGIGQRACIGQQFALQEATLMLGLILKNFEIIDHTNYKLKIMETLTLKPDGFTMQIRPRNMQKGYFFTSGNGRKTQTEENKAVERDALNLVERHDTPLLVLYGSDLGTAEGIARELADTARFQGFRSKVAPLNDYAGNLPAEGVIYIVTASYNGTPPNNARAFVQWLHEIKPGELEGIRYCVFGCGDRNWASTYQSVPKWIDEQLTAKGAQRLFTLGEGDVSGDFETEVETWQEQLWPTVMDALGLSLSEKTTSKSPALSMHYVSSASETPLAETYDALYAKVLDNRELQQEGSGRSTRHIEVKLPEGISYREGDHLGVFPLNRKELVERVLKRFELNSNDQVILKASRLSTAHLPLDRPVKLYDLLSRSVELQGVATRAQIRELAALTECPPHQQELTALLEETAYKLNILQKRISMLDLLEKYEACELSFERFLELLPPLKVRYYSISSSPRLQPKQVSVTVSVVRAPAWSGLNEYRGVASNYLADIQPGDSIVMFIRTPESGFQLPEDPGTPIIMVGPGVGIAPFRGFLQARRELKREGVQLGTAHLYFGCRNEADDIYRAELEQFQQEGIATVYKAYSRKGHSKTYVQHLMHQQEQELIRILDKGGRFYVCGDGSKMAPDVEATLQRSYQAVYGVSEAEAKTWLDRLEVEGRYVKDVWAGGKLVSMDE